MKPISPLVQLAQWFDGKGILALASGLLIALSFPNWNYSFLAWGALIPLISTLRGTSLKTAFRLGFMCGIGAYASILYWLNIVMVHYGHLPLPLSIVLYLVLVAWLALFFGCSVVVARLGERVGLSLICSLPIAWTAFDFIRSFLLTGFPWAMLGHSQFRVLPLIQVADLVGVYGITWLIVIANVTLYWALRSFTVRGQPYPLKSTLFVLILLSAMLFYGFHRLNMPLNTNSVPLKVAVIQGNIDQNIKWNAAFQEQTISTYERLSRNAGQQSVNLLVWPESAVPFFFQDEQRYAERIKTLAKELHSSILFGSPAYEQRGGRTHYLNSAFMLSPTGELVGRADKIHLVPFGEYVPLARLLPFVSKLVTGIGDFSPGEKPVPLACGNTLIGTLVCFEGVFPELAREHVRAGARVLAIITNDAWYGKSSAPYQHLSMAVFRAVETRTPLLRAANTGISAIIDHNGHIHTMTGLFVEGVSSGEIRPGPGNSIYLAIGDTAAWICVVLSGIILLTGLLSRKSY